MTQVGVWWENLQDYIFQKIKQTINMDAKSKSGHPDFPMKI